MTRDEQGKAFSAMSKEELFKRIATLEKRLQLQQEDQRRQERINDNHRNLLFKVNVEYEALLEKHERLAEELHYKNAHLSGIFENATFPLLTFDGDLQLMTFNQRAVALLEGNEPFQEGAPLDALIPHELFRKVGEFAALSQAEGAPKIFDSVLRTHGADHWLEITLFPLSQQKGGKSDFCCIVRDQTAVREELATQIMEGQLFEYGALMASIVHEINNPLNGIVNYLELLLDNEQDADSRVLLKEAVKLTARVTKIGRAMLVNIGDASDSEVLAFSLASVVDDALLLLRHELRRCRVELVRDFPNDDELFCGRQVELLLIVQNLMLNAIQALEGYTQPENARHQIRVGYAFPSDADECRLYVRDNGPGIEPRDLPRIFHPFFTTKESGKGTGLGLYISRKLAHKQGWSLDVQTAASGTTFTLRMPRFSEVS